MTETNTNECRFCMKVIYDDNFDIIGEVTWKRLNTLLLKVNLKKDKESVSCLECATKLQNAVDFKINCLNTNSKTPPLIDFKSDAKLVSEEETCKKNAGIELTNIPKGQKICQFCMKLTQSGSCTYLHDRKEGVFIIDMVQKHIPEMHLNVSGELVTCNSCISSLQNLSSFITICSETEEKINKMDRETVDGQFKLNNNKNFPLQYANVADIGENFSNSVEEITVKNEGECENCTEIDDLDVNIKSEEIEIKLEHDDYKSCISSLHNLSSFITICSKTEEKNNKTDRETVDGQFKLNSKNCPLQYADVADIEENLSNRVEDITVKNEGEREDCTEIDDLDVNIKSEEIEIKLEHGDYESYQDTTSSSQLIDPEKSTFQDIETKNATVSPLEIYKYKCNMCSYKTKIKLLLKRHGLVHQSPLEVKMFNCEKCSFTTKYSGNLNTHMRTHENPPKYTKSTIHKCDRCSYETRKNSALERHMLVHKGPSELYKCGKCSFRTKHKDILKCHIMCHQQLTMYNCHKCQFETKNKKQLMQHVRNHQNSSARYRCKVCCFITKYKGNLGAHMVTHQDIPNIKTYKCEICSFNTKIKVVLERHRLIHKDTSTMTLYKCEVCPHKTNRKHNLKRHMLTHKSLSELEKYRCESCSFETKYKRCLKQHLQVHQTDGPKNDAE